MKILPAILSAVLLTGFLIANPGQTGRVRIQPPTRFDGNIWASALALYATAEGRTKQICTATPYEKVAGGYRLISAGHCVQEIPAKAVFSVVEDIGGELKPITMVKARLEGSMDFSIFEMKTDKNYVLVPFDDAPLKVGEPTVSVHFSEGLVKQISHGVIASGALLDAGHCKGMCGGDFIVQMYGAPGASGALVISAKTHRAIGIVVMGFSGENLGMVVEPLSSFSKFMSLPPQAHPADED